MKAAVLDITKTLIFIAIGTFIFSFGVNYFVIANGLGEGGVTGIALVLNYQFGIPPSVTILLLNIPLFILGMWKLGFRSMIYTILGVLFVTLFLWLTDQFRFPMEDLMLSALFGGVLIGLGLGINFRAGGTTGGSDIAARLMFRYFRVNMGRTMLIIDAVVISGSAFIIGLEKAMYTLVMVFVASKIIDFVQEGAYAARSAMIISDYTEEIAERIIHDMKRGATISKARGAYTNNEKEILFCVISRNEIARLKKLVREIDPKAFIVLSDVHDVLGEGFERK
jgi:uncharacterized membrane-anchored protein YitT (DUF2179 family)